MSSKFDIDKLTNFAIKRIAEFAKEHQDETFYGFTIDANLLCFNSIEQFEKELKKYQSKYDGYDTLEKIENLKLNTGDWKYQGFAEFDKENGFDMDEYLEHFHQDDENLIYSDYAITMNEVIEKLKLSAVFKKLKTTNNFFINRTEHNY